MANHSLATKYNGTLEHISFSILSDVSEETYHSQFWCNRHPKVAEVPSPFSLQFEAHGSLKKTCAMPM